MSGEPLLALDDVYAAYGESQVINGISLDIEQGQVVSLIGRNGAGKTSTLRTIIGVLTPHQGTIRFDGEDVTGLRDHEKTKRGIRFVPEDRRLFPDLTVHENLRMGAIAADEGIYSIAEAFEAFPRLDERRDNLASHLSGGEQQMLAIARALVGETRLLLLDEPTEGLAPQIVEDVIEIIDKIKQRDLTVLIAEQNIHAAMAVADRHNVIDKGRIVFEGSTEELESDQAVQEQHLGVGVEVSGAFD